MKCFLSATSVQMAMFSFPPEHCDRLQEMVLKGFFRHFMKGIMFLKRNLVSQRNIVYHKIIVFSGDAAKSSSHSGNVNCVPQNRPKITFLKGHHSNAWGGGVVEY